MAIFSNKVIFKNQCILEFPVVYQFDFIPQIKRIAAQITLCNL